VDKAYVRIAAALLIGLAGYLVGLSIATHAAIAATEQYLVEQGHAEYYLDADNQRQWRMKECE
jgi:adenylylsulfate kinase-like enzyme